MKKELILASIVAMSLNSCNKPSKQPSEKHTGRIEHIDIVRDGGYTQNVSLDKATATIYNNDVKDTLRIRFEFNADYEIYSKAILEGDSIEYLVSKTNANVIGVEYKDIKFLKYANSSNRKTSQKTHTGRIDDVDIFRDGTYSKNISLDRAIATLNNSSNGRDILDIHFEFNADYDKYQKAILEGDSIEYPVPKTHTNVIKVEYEDIKFLKYAKR